jgi:hypothetical protein
LILGALGVAAATSSALPRKLIFEPNRGQAPAGVKWIARGPSYEAYFTADGITLRIPEASTASLLRMTFPGGSPWKHFAGLDPTGGISNYLVGSDPKPGLSGIPHYDRLKISGVYPGIDLVLYGNAGELEYDLVLAPHADPQRIQVAFQGQKDLRLDATSGDLVLTTSHGSTFRQLRPQIHQTRRGRRVEVAGGYVLRGDRAAFRLGDYDRSLPLVVDPVLANALLIPNTAPHAIAVDGDGNTYLTGETQAIGFPLVNAFDSRAWCDSHDTTGFCAIVQDGFIMKLAPDGTILFSTYFGEGDWDAGLGIAVDASGVYVTGYWGVWHKDPFSGDAIVLKTNLDGKVQWFRRFGGTSDESGNAIALDSQHNVWVTGSTNSLDWPDKNVEPDRRAGGHTDLFVVKMSPNGDMLFSEFMGGTGGDVGYGIAVDRTDNAWVTGGTCSPDFPTSPGAGWATGNCAVFVMKFNGTRRAFTTTFGGSAVGDVGLAIALDGSDMAYVTGYTHSLNFPTTFGAYQGARSSGGLQAFVTAIDSFGHIVHCTLLGGDGDTSGTAIALDASRDVFVNVTTTSTHFPGIAAPPPPPFGAVLRISRNLKTLAHANYFGWSLDAVAVQPPTFGKPTSFVIGGDTGEDGYFARLTEDGVRDSVLWYNQGSGEVQAWNLTHVYTVAGKQVLPWRCGPQEGCPSTFQITTTGDLNGDGFGDVILHNVATGEVQAWLLNGEGGVIGTRSLSQHCGPSDGCSTTWKLIGVGDFNGDQRPDVLWQNLSTGEVKAWLLDDTGGPLGYLTLAWKCGPNEGCPTNWKMIGVGDVNLDGKDDVVLHNVTTGEVQAWLLNSFGGVIGTRTFGFQCDAASGCSSSWKFVGLGDFNRDGLVDLLWHNNATGVEMAILQDAAGALKDSRTFLTKCGAADGCAGWTPVGTFRDYHLSPQ